MSDKAWYPGCATGRLLSCTPQHHWSLAIGIAVSPRCEPQHFGKVTAILPKFIIKHLDSAQSRDYLFMPKFTVFIPQRITHYTVVASLSKSNDATKIVSTFSYSHIHRSCLCRVYGFQLFIWNEIMINNRHAGIAGVGIRDGMPIIFVLLRNNNNIYVLKETDARYFQLTFEGSLRVFTVVHGYEYHVVRGGLGLLGGCWWWWCTLRHYAMNRNTEY